MNKLEELQKKEEELDRLISGNPEEGAEELEDALESPGPTEAAETEDSQELRSTQEDTQKVITKDPEDDTAQRLAQVELRFRKYKASTDKTIYELRQENSKLNGNLANMLEKLNSTKKNVEVADIFSKEDEEVLGPEALAVIRKVREDAQKQIEDLRQERLREQKEESKRKSTNSKEDAKREFDEALTDAVPNWKAIISQKAFRKYLSETSRYGKTLEERFRAAEARGDLDILVDIFDRYENLPEAKDPLKEHVTPKQASSQVKKQEGEGKITQKDVQEHFKRVKSGYYLKRPKGIEEQRKMDKRIDAYYTKGD